MARVLRKEKGISYNAPMDLALHTVDETTLKPRLALSPLPKGLDPRWTSADADSFLELVRDFVQDTGYLSFLRQHYEMYRQAAKRLKAVVQSQGHLEWFDAFFGGTPKSSFTVIAATLTGPFCYGTTVILPNSEELYSVLGVWKIDHRGVPDFDSSVLPTVIHEFCHSYVNPLVDRHQASFRSAGETIYPHVSEAMARQAYGSWNIVLRESLVRACTICHARKYLGPAAAREQMQTDRESHFLWIEGLSDLVDNYEKNRAVYSSFDRFMPKIADFFRQWAEQMQP
jgi:hypothetical protein